MDITYVCIIIRGTIKQIKIKFIYGGRPSYRAKTMRTERKLTKTVNLHIKRKKCTTYGHHICMYYPQRYYKTN